MHPFVRQDPPAEYTALEWRHGNVSIVCIRNWDNISVQAWVHRNGACPDVLCPEWRTTSPDEALAVAEELAGVLAPFVLSGALTATGSRALHLLAMKEYGDVYDNVVKLYNRTEPRGENPWAEEAARVEEELATGIRRHHFKLDREAPSLGAEMWGRHRSRTPARPD